MVEEEAVRKSGSGKYYLVPSVDCLIVGKATAGSQKAQDSHLTAGLPAVVYPAPYLNSTRIYKICQ